MQVETINAIMSHNVVFVSAQPDTVYFHWQVELYLYQFAKHGIADQCYAIFGHQTEEPSEGLQELQRRYPHVMCYKDDREDRFYVPSIRPHVLKKFFAAYPELGKNVFYHDSDIFLVKLPKFELFLGENNNMGYVSDTVSYIGAEYIEKCARRYKEVHSALPDNDILTQMCACVNIDAEVIRKNELHSGGAQYFLRDMDAAFWAACEVACKNLYRMLKDYEKKYPVAHHIQSWTTDMWIVLWEYWKRGGETRVHSELAFSWATGSISDYFTQNIFHLAGVTGETCSDKFYKGKYVSLNIFKEYVKNPSIFDHVSASNATHGYVTVLKEFVTANKDRFDVSLIEKAQHDRFTAAFSSGKVYDGTYNKDTHTIHFGKPVWRSIKGYIIFFNLTSWILTHSRYEHEISETCGGFASNKDEYPYDQGGWNESCVVTF